MSKWIRASVVLASLAGFCTSSYAVAPGFYVGLMEGPATNSAGTQQAQVSATTTTPATAKSNQWGSRIYMGYKINQYAGVEGGLNYFSTIRYDTKEVNTCSSVTARVRDFDVVGKADYPLGSVDLFGKAGVAITYLTTSGALNPGSDPNNSSCGKSQYTTKYNPTFSVGASYDLSQNWVADLSWNRTSVGSAVGNVDFFALGISYHFVNIYCGQFLCG
jgi:opacity protein-like surface antigen